MDHDYEGGRRRLPRYDEDDGSGQDAIRRGTIRRDEGVRRTRRATSWTAAALIAGLAASSGYFVHAAAAPSVASTVQVQPGSAGVTGHKPSLSHPVATSGGSGVTAGATGQGGAAGSGGTGSTGAAWRDN
ncbi:MAG TPA: hypothetical protein VH480_15190 [Streptosporangiaceae bacterium]|jgi:hypothetical protein